MKTAVITRYRKAKAASPSMTSGELLSRYLPVGVVAGRRYDVRFRVSRSGKRVLVHEVETVPATSAVVERTAVLTLPGGGRIR